jgi:hypothetical protein
MFLSSATISAVKVLSNRKVIRKQTEDVKTRFDLPQALYLEQPSLRSLPVVLSTRYGKSVDKTMDMDGCRRKS